MKSAAGFREPRPEVKLKYFINSLNRVTMQGLCVFIQQNSLATYVCFMKDCYTSENLKATMQPDASQMGNIVQYRSNYGNYGSLNCMRSMAAETGFLVVALSISKFPPVED